MTDDSIHALGPLFGPDFITIVGISNGNPYALEIFPDANNPALKMNGLPTQFYYMPKQISLARRVDAPDDFDFGVTLFKGLMTEEDTLIPGGAPTVGGELDAGGAFVSFSTTMAVPDEVVAGALAKLINKDHEPPPVRIGQFFLRDPADPPPLLGIVPIVDNSVTLEVPQLPGAGDTKSPFFISAQGTGKGSIEASGVSSFLVTCNQLAAGAIVGALKGGHSPFTVHYNMKLLFYINACDIQIHVDVDKVFTQFSGAAAVNVGFLQADLSANYQSCVTNGGITTVIQQNGTDVDPDMKTFIEKQASDMQDKAWALVKSEIFDWQPKPDDPAKASTGACGGAAISLKLNYQKHGVVFDDHFEINQTISKEDTVAGTLNDLEPAIKQNLDKYLSIVDIGEAFKKVQVVASPNIDFGGDDVADPISAALVQVTFLDPDNPVGADGKPQFVVRSEGFHQIPGMPDASAAPVTLGRWSKDNPKDLITFAMLRLDGPSPAGWDKDQVKITKTLVYGVDDARVALSNGTTTVVTETITMAHNPVVGPEEVGYVFVKFFLDRPIKTSNVTVTLTVQFADSTTVIEMTNTDPKANPVGVWQVWSDKYFDDVIAKVRIDVEVAPPPSMFAGDAVNWSGVQAIPLNLGRIKKIVPCKIELPELTDPDQLKLVSQYILQAAKDAAGV